MIRKWRDYSGWKQCNRWGSYKERGKQESLRKRHDGSRGQSNAIAGFEVGRDQGM